MQKRLIMVFHLVCNGEKPREPLVVLRERIHLRVQPVVLRLQLLDLHAQLRDLTTRALTRWREIKKKEKKKKRAYATTKNTLLHA